MILLLIIAPISQVIYLIFPINGFGEFLINTQFLVIPNFIETEAWFYQTLYMFAFSNGTIWAPLISIYGLYLLFPKNYYPSYIVGVPFGYFLSSLIHRLFVKTDAEFHEGYGIAVVAMFLVLGVVIMVASDKLLFNENHRRRATEARIIGLINTPGVDWKEKEELLKKEAKEWMKNDNELFNRTG